MKPNSNFKRSRGRGNRRSNGAGRSSGNVNDAKSRNNANQTHEKYLALARDALAGGDRVAAENYFQHADHYYRVVAGKNERRQQRNAEAQAAQATAGEGENGDRREDATDAPEAADLTEETATSGSA